MPILQGDPVLSQTLVSQAGRLRHAFTIMGRVIFALALLLFTISSIVAQQNAKPGACPPPVAIGICDMTCFSDSQCEGNNKCCRTGCGGTFCTFPVTVGTNVNRGK